MVGNFYWFLQRYTTQKFDSKLSESYSHRIKYIKLACNFYQKQLFKWQKQEGFFSIISLINNSCDQITTVK